MLWMALSTSVALESMRGRSRDCKEAMSAVLAGLEVILKAMPDRWLLVVGFISEVQSNKENKCYE